MQVVERRRVVENLDRRRRLRRAERLGEAVLRHTRWLPPGEAALLIGFYHAGRPPHELGALTGLDRRAARRRIRGIAERTLRPSFLAAVRMLETAPALPDWPPAPGSLAAARPELITLAVVRAVYIEGLSRRAAAVRLDLKEHVVRRHFDAVRGRIEAGRV